MSPSPVWGYARACAAGLASPPPALFETLLAPFPRAAAALAGGAGTFLDMFAVAFAVNLLVFAWCRRKVEEQKAKIAALAKTTLTPEEREIVYHGPAEKKHIIYQNQTSGAAGEMHDRRAPQESRRRAAPAPPLHVRPPPPSVAPPLSLC